MNKEEQEDPQQEQISTVQENDPRNLQQLGMLLVSPGLDEDRLSEKMISKIKKSRDIEKIKNCSYLGCRKKRKIIVVSLLPLRFLQQRKPYPLSR